MTGHATTTKRRRNRCTAFARTAGARRPWSSRWSLRPFLALIIALIQTFLVFFAQQLLESVVRQSGRLVMTGQVQNQQMTAAFKQNAQRLAADSQDTSSHIHNPISNATAIPVASPTIFTPEYILLFSRLRQATLR